MFFVVPGPEDHLVVPKEKFNTGTKNNIRNLNFRRREFCFFCWGGWPRKGPFYSATRKSVRNPGSGKGKLRPCLFSLGVAPHGVILQCHIKHLRNPGFGKGKLWPFFVFLEGPRKRPLLQCHKKKFLKSKFWKGEIIFFLVVPKGAFLHCHKNKH